MRRIKQINNLLIFQAVVGKNTHYLVKSPQGKVLEQFATKHGTSGEAIRALERAEEFCRKSFDFIQTRYYVELSSNEQASNVNQKARNFDEAEMIARRFCRRKPRPMDVARVATVYRTKHKVKLIQFHM